MAKRRRGRDDMTSSHVYVLRDFLGRPVEHPRMLPASEVQFHGCEDIGEEEHPSVLRAANIRKR